MFSGLKSSASPEPSSSIIGIYPHTRSRTRKHKNGDSDSVVEFAQEGGIAGKAYVLRDLTPSEVGVEKPGVSPSKSSATMKS
jgi:hypothetical protein